MSTHRSVPIPGIFIPTPEGEVRPSIFLEVVTV